MAISSAETIIVKPHSLTYGGDALARLPDGRIVFVPFALPGEEVQVRFSVQKRSHVRAELTQVLTPSPERIRPVCAHFTVCGGCHYQHIPYAHQLTYKTCILREQLERISGLTTIPLQTCVPSPQPFNYRNYVQFHLNQEGRLGYLAPHSSRVIQIQECHLPDPVLNQVWPQLDLEPIPGLERVSLRLGMEEEVQVIFESSDPQPFDFSVEELTLSAVHLGPGGALVLAGSEILWMQILDRTFQVSAGSFFQVNTPMAAVMVKHLLEILPLSPQSTLLEVYCGVGLFSAFLAPRVHQLIGIEISTTACEDFAINLDEFDNVALYAAPAEEVLRGIQFHPDIILVDPPRAGLGNSTVEALIAQQASWLAYVSCDPATLARDARRLVAGGYVLRQIIPFDVFPQTFHIESISLWERG